MFAESVIHEYSIDYFYDLLPKMMPFGMRWYSAINIFLNISLHYFTFLSIFNDLITLGKWNQEKLTDK